MQQITMIRSKVLALQVFSCFWLHKNGDHFLRMVFRQGTNSMHTNLSRYDDPFKR